MVNYNVIGTMSGTSLDGLDMAYCQFIFDGQQWSYTMSIAETITYSEELKQQLSSVETGSAFELAMLHQSFGHFIGQQVKNFREKHRIDVDFVSSHGHTIFHQPSQQLTLQIGDGASIAAECGCPVVADFRTLDVALGGQGAPLVPIGDQLLFNSYDYCLNLGGIANVSYEKEGDRLAFDVCLVNMALNPIAQQLGSPFDGEGAFAREGMLNNNLLAALNELSYYKQKPPKSLGKEWYLTHFKPLIDSFQLSPKDALHTICEHISQQIAIAINSKPEHQILVTGGGAFNAFLLERMQHYASGKVSPGDKELVEFKEALIFAFLGVLRYRNEVNCLQSVTGATKNNVGGAIYWNSN